MTIEPRILVISTIADVATDFVVQGLNQLGVPVCRLNTESLPFDESMTFSVESHRRPVLCFGEREQSSPTSVWYRRVRVPARPPEMDVGVYDFCLKETRTALIGSVMSLEGRWMSHPADVWRAEFKPYQLSVAAALGLTVPKTVVTNKPDAVRQAFQEFGQMVAKPCRSGYVQVDGEARSIYTSRVLDEHLAHIDEVRVSPAIYQQLIPKRYDVRVTVVGDRMFAAAIDSQSDEEAKVDWRHTSNPQLPHYPIELPSEVRGALAKLMKQLGLTFGAIDLVQTPDGEFVFLEVNPNGQWLWIDDALQTGITEAIVEWLART